MTRLPARGDVLVSRRSASQDYEVSVVPEEAQLVGERYAAAIAHALDLASRLSVDAWYTEDLIHFVLVSHVDETPGRTGIVARPASRERRA
jgi:hypothetical protein